MASSRYVTQTKVKGRRQTYACFQLALCRSEIQPAAAFQIRVGGESAPLIGGRRAETPERRFDHVPI